MKLIKRLTARLTDPGRSYEERNYIMLSIIGVGAMIVADIFNVIGGESMVEVIMIAAAIIGIPIIVTITVHFQKVKLGSVISVCTLVFIILPITFFFGGGTKGGGIFWIIFSYMFIGMSLSGKLRNIIMFLLTFISCFEFWVSFRHVELITPHTAKMAFLDELVSILLVGFCTYIMLMYQKSMFKEENSRALAEAERAEELNRSQNRFFSSMSHEIRTPINSILGLNELILRDQDASDDIVKDAAGIQGSGKMLLALINDILDFSKMEAGSMDIVPVDYRVADMLSEIVNMMWLRAQDKGLSFEVNVDPDVPTVLYGDEVRIKQIVVNLLNNAVKYTNKGNIELRIESAETDDNTCELMISVSDTGMGIKKESIPYLFDAFKRVDEKKNRNIEGTGLGLSIVKQLVDLMGGTITVNSVYGEGSTFTVSLKQTISDRNRIGDLNIHNQQGVKRSKYESSFLAPDARVLIVDDNEMNLEVERRLLEDTDMGIDTAKNGKEALEKCLSTHYDAIFMDHLMPEMDGVECLSLLRDQAGGFNRSTPVIILTANAGSENRELYNRAGFDGYLVKPVSGEAMEEILIKHISPDKLILKTVMMSDDKEIHTTDKYFEKLPVIITSSSMCDLPDQVIKKLHIPIIPFKIKTEEGVFKDGVHIDAYELIRHIRAGKEAVSLPPDEAAYTEFFAEQLKKAHHIIYISITTSMSDEYKIASEAAKAFDNVTVINSGCLSSSTGILVLIAYKLMQQGIPVEDMITEIEDAKNRLRCSFIIDSTEYMSKKGLVSKNLHRIVEMINLHPSLRIRDDRADVAGLWVGRTRRAYRKYINKAIPSGSVADPEVVFITYADVPFETLAWIEEEVKKITDFEHVIFQQASAAISSNCGPGSFGILYFVRSGKSYNIASLITDHRVFSEEDVQDIEPEITEELTVLAGETEKEDTETKSGEKEDTKNEDKFSDLDFIDVNTALENSGSEDSLNAVLKIFRESINDRYEELKKCYNEKDWENYTIKIHALKSSARLVGALDLGDAAERLEAAGKEKDTDYINDNHADAIEMLLYYGKRFDEYFEKDKDPGEDKKPLADEYLMESIYEELKDAAENMDIDRIEDIMKETDGYEIPDGEKEKYALIKQKADMLDYEGIQDILS